MLEDLFESTSEFTPRDAFLFAFDDAIKATVQSLTDIGLDDKSIWAAFSEALDLCHKTAVEVDGEGPMRAKARSKFSGRTDSSKMAESGAACRS
jgi:hypothetical protein